MINQIGVFEGTFKNAPVDGAASGLSEREAFIKAGGDPELAGSFSEDRNDSGQDVNGNIWLFWAK